tara:strand:+ start:188 stop:637 length:450 start_codon:yes stop_codon:yes gene_type:complete
VYEKYKKPEFYMSKTEADKNYFLSHIVANTHHMIIFIAASYALLYPDCAPDSPFTFQILADPVCFYTVDSLCVKTCLITLSYMLYDFILYIKCFDLTSKDKKIVIVHHILAITTIIFGLTAGYGAPGLLNICLLCEISTFFINKNAIMV